MYKCKYFAIHELVPPAIYHDRGEKAWELLDDRACMALDDLRDKFGKMTVNNYYWGGPREWSGLRTPDSPYYSRTSQHSFGRAFDCLFTDVLVSQVRRNILDNPNQYPLIMSVELDVDWLHFDVRNCDRIKTYTP